MPEDWLSVITDVDTALADVGFDALLEKPGVKSGPSYAPVFGVGPRFPIRVIQKQREERNQEGTLTGRVVTSFLLSANATIPERGDKIITPDGTPYVIETVRKTMPGGTVLLYRVMSLT